MSYDCFCDYDPAEVYSASIRRARKQYKCEECAGTIMPGDQYEYVFGKWEGWVDTFRTCQHCRDLRQWVHNNVPCFCWAHGNLQEDMRSTVEDAVRRAPDETRGLWFGYLRRTVQRDKFHQARRHA